VRDRAGLEAFVTAHLEGAAGPGDAVRRRRGHAAGGGRRPSPPGARWTRGLDAMKTVPEFRAASRQMGRQTARVAATLGDDAVLAGVVRAIDDGLAPATRRGLRRRRRALRRRCRAGRRRPISTRRPRCSSAAPACGCLPWASSTASACWRPCGRSSRGSPRRRRARTAEDMWTFTPALELAGLRHARLDMRLFRSMTISPSAPRSASGAPSAPQERRSPRRSAAPARRARHGRDHQRHLTKEDAGSRGRAGPWQRARSWAGEPRQAAQHTGDPEYAPRWNLERQRSWNC